MNSNNGASLPRELHLSQKPDSSATRNSRPSGAVIGNEGLAIKPFGAKEPLEDGPRNGLGTNFRRTMMYIRHGDPNLAIIGMRKFSMLMHQINEKELWHGLETLKEASSDSERGNELRFNALQMLNLVESELWLRLGALAETGKNKSADPEARVNAFKGMEWLYPRLIKHLADQTKPKNADGKPKEAVAGDAETDGKVAAGLPAWSADSVRAAMEEYAKEHFAGMRSAALAVEEKMAGAILKVATSGKDDEAVCDAAFQALNGIDSPVLTRMLNNAGAYVVPDESSEAGVVPEEINPEFDITDLDPRMWIGPKD
jgi:hypothetical protein